MWLEGVEEMQPEGWSPDKRQWDRIREKINQLEAPAAAPQYSQPQFSPQQYQYREEPQLDPNRQVQFAGGGLPRAAAPPAPNNQLFGNSDTPGVPSRTPNVDTSTGGYEPAFI